MVLWKHQIVKDAHLQWNLSSLFGISFIFKIAQNKHNKMSIRDSFGNIEDILIIHTW